MVRRRAPRRISRTRGTIADEQHPLASLADYLGNLIEGYEAEHHPV